MNSATLDRLLGHGSDNSNIEFGRVAGWGPELDLARLCDLLERPDPPILHQRSISDVSPFNLDEASKRVDGNALVEVCVSDYCGRYNCLASDMQKVRDQIRDASGEHHTKSELFALTCPPEVPSL